jgi:hypothetical protein
MACDIQDQCGFFRKFGNRQSNVWKGLFGYYCIGNGFKFCENRKKFQKDGKFPDYQFIPTGKAVPKSFLDLP